MKHQKKSLMVCLCLALIFISCVACNGYRDLVIENQTTKVLTIYSDETALGNVGPGAQIIQRRIPSNSTPWLIVAKNLQGETVFSRSFKYNDMQYIGNGTYKVVITRSEKGAEISSNTTVNK